MRKVLFRLLTVLALFANGFARADEPRSLVSQKFPHTKDLEIVCWVAPQEGEGYLSQIVVFQTGTDGRARVLWQSALDSAYSPKIQFLDEITISGVPIALIERQTGAASSQLDIIGKMSGHIERLLRIDGFMFDVEHLDGSKLPFIIAHRDASILDVPAIYRWQRDHFMDDSAAHPDYYRKLLTEDKAKLPPNSSGVVLVNLSRVAVLSGNRAEAKTILSEALSRERAKGNTANKETLRRITEALRKLGTRSR